MANSASPNSQLRKLGFWFSVFGISLSLMAAVPSEDPDFSRRAWQTHWMPTSSIATWASAYCTPAGAAGRGLEFSRLPLKDVVVPRIELLAPLPLPPADANLGDRDNAREKNVSLRGRKAERLYRPIILRVARRHKVDPNMVKAIIMAESSFNPKAISNRGAVGLMQLMPNTAKSLGVDDAFDPEKNIKAGVLYFKKLLKEFRGDVELALAAYNAGSRKVKEYQGVPPFKTTLAYIRKVFEYYRHYRNQALHPADRA